MPCCFGLKLPYLAGLTQKKAFLHDKDGNRGSAESQRHEIGWDGGREGPFRCRQRRISLRAITKGKTMSEYSILLVEDDENDVFFFQRAMKDAQLQNPLSVARDGLEAIDYLSGNGAFADREQYPLPCLLILDLKMPRKSGLEVLEWLRSEPSLRTLPAIILSSSAQTTDIDRAYQLGANAFVVKPTTVGSRVELLRSIKGFWLQYSRPPAFCSSANTALLA
jgi:CheY-like chemotaxis protein